MKKPAIIKPWEIAFCVIYYGRYSLFQNRPLVHETLKNIAHLQDCEYYAPAIPAILSESVAKGLKDGSELWVEDHFFRSGENPPMPRYMFARLIASVFQRYGQNTDMPFCVCQRGIAEMRALGQCTWPLEDCNT